MGRWIEEFPGNLAWSNATLVCKGMAPYGCVSLAEIDRVCDRLRAREGEVQAWWEEWGAMAAAVEARADALERAGHRRSAGNLYLRAGMYWFTAERFVEPGEHKRELGRRSIEMQGRGLQRRYPGIERVEVACEGVDLPAWFLPAQRATGPAPVVVVFNGMDNCKEMSVLFAGLEFSARGWHTLAIDGPGQGESLRLRGLSARHDYEVPGSAAYDFLAARADVDPGRVAVMGYSFGGYYAARIAAFEPRYVAGVAFAALHWDLHAWQLEIRRRQLADPQSTAQSTFHFQWVMGEGTPEAAIEKARAFSLEGIAPRIRMPFLVLHGEADRVVPVAAAHRLHAELGSTDKALRLFGPEEGGAQHAQVDDRPLGVDAIADWLEHVLGPAADARGAR
jgi:alpha-beta hydrolase superfamily lysophospholipase